MTEQTQTTAERIKALLIPHPFDDFQLRRTIQTIAAEIDRLTAERDGYEAGMRFQFDRAEDYKAQRDEARAEVERLTPKARLWESDEALRLARGVRRQARLHRTRIDLLAAQDEAHIQAQRDTPPSSAERMAALDAAAAARARAAKETP